MGTRVRCRCVAAAPRYVIPKNVERVLAELVDSGEAAAIIGLTSGSKGFASYISHYPDFPPPVQVGESGRCSRWYAPHIHQWRELHPPRRQPAE
jgi:predicted DNA-binding transcriptional regulator AlpA